MNAIQEERTKSYFITAAKDLIRGEGLAVVSARNVAERAGYSYATLYNYFKDIRDLIFSCIEGFLEECRVFVESQSSGVKEGKEHFQTVTLNYVKFFIQYPGIFDLFFQQKASTVSTKTSDFKKIYLFFDTVAKRDWECVVSQHEPRLSECASRYDFFKMSLHGLLMVYLNNRVDFGYQELLDNVVSLCNCSLDF